MNMGQVLAIAVLVGLMCLAAIFLVRALWAQNDFAIAIAMCAVTVFLFLVIAAFFTLLVYLGHYGYTGNWTIDWDYI